MFKDIIPKAWAALDTGFSGISSQVESVDTETNVFTQLGTIINYFLGALGVVMLLMILYAGVQILVSQGNEEKVAAARKIIIYGVIGVIIIALSYAINSWIFGSPFFLSPS